MARHPTWRDPADGPAAAFAAELRELREQAGHKAPTVDQISRDTGVSRSTLYTALKGDRIPGQDVVRALVKAWGGNTDNWDVKRREVEGQIEAQRLKKRDSRASFWKRRTVTVDLKIPGVGHVSGTWTPQPVEVQASWELYLEIVTRMIVIDRSPTAHPQDTLNSLHEIFGVVREILRNAGPQIAARDGSGISFGRLAVEFLNGTIRPVLAEWFPRLTAWESQLPQGSDPIEAARNWEHIADFYRDVDHAKVATREFAQLLGQVVNVDIELPTR